MTARPARAAFPEPATLGERVHGELRRQLIAGDYAPGDKLSLRALAERFGLSMTPVRAAVARLVADGALEVLPNRAVHVPVMSRGQFAELTAVRLAVEGLAAERAAALRTPAELAAVRRHDAAFRRACRAARPDMAAAVRHNMELHFAVYRATRLPTLVAIIEGLWLRIGPVLNLDMRASALRIRTNRAEVHHAALVAALAAGDGPAARAALAADITEAAAFIQSRGKLPD